MEKIFLKNYNYKYIPNRGKYQQMVRTSDITNPALYVNEKQSFIINFRDVFNGYEKYYTTDHDKEVQDKWQKSPMKLYQSQINFATHIATTACGISQEHLNHKNPLLRSVFRFHTYYQIRKVLKYLRIRLVGDDKFDGLDSGYDVDRFGELLSKYGLDGFVWKNDKIYSTFQEKRKYYDTPGLEYFDNDSWSRWIIFNSQGLSKIGVELLSESVMIYVYLVLTSQVKGKSVIVGEDGRQIEVQRIFLNTFNDDILKRNFNDVGGLVQMYQDVLVYARSKVDFVIGEGIYMLPSDLRMRLGGLLYYNNKLVIADSYMKVGENSNVNMLVKDEKETKKDGAVVDSGGIIVAKDDKRQERVTAEQKIQESNVPKTNRTVLVVSAMTGVFLVAFYVEYRRKNNPR